MAYSINPNLVKARRNALRELIGGKLPVNVVARKYGVNRSTIWRWKKKWLELNRNLRKDLNQLSNYRWTILTLSSCPHSFPAALPEWIVERVMELRRKLKRCAEVIWHYLTKEGIRISLSSVRRILARHHYYDRNKGEQRPYRRNIKRPVPQSPGDLVQIDTVHLVDTYTGKRKYIYTVIDLCTRMAYARVYERIYQIPALETVLIAEQRFGFRFKVVQSDNGSEFGRTFKERLEASGDRQIRHSRPHRPNDNAHIERFNRTLREECIGHYMSSSKTVAQIQSKLDAYLDYYNNERVHLALQCDTPSMVASGMLQRW